MPALVSFIFAMWLIFSFLLSSGSTAATKFVKQKRIGAFFMQAIISWVLIGWIPVTVIALFIKAIS